MTQELKTPCRLPEKRYVSTWRPATFGRSFSRISHSWKTDLSSGREKTQIQRNTARKNPTDGAYPENHDDLPPKSENHTLEVKVAAAMIPDPVTTASSWGSTGLLRNPASRAVSNAIASIPHLYRNSVPTTKAVNQVPTTGGR